MTKFVGNIEKLTTENEYFRKVIFTGQHTQLVLMSLKPGEEIGMEIHEIVDQFLRFESGEGRVIIDGSGYEVKDGDAVVIPAGSQHNVINTSNNEPLKIYTLYSPPHHKDGTVHETKTQAESDSEDHI